MQAAGPDVTRTPRRAGGLLRQRNFRLLWIGETVSAVGNAMAMVGVPLLAVIVLKASTFAVSVLTAAAFVPWLVIGLHAGVWVDRLSCRPLMVACDIASMLLYASLPVAAWLDVLTTWQVGVVAFLAGIANVFFATAYQVYLPSLVTAAELIEGNAKLQGSASAAGIGGRAWLAWRPKRSARSRHCCSTRPASWSPPPFCCPSGLEQPANQLGP